ncbi:MAG: GrpB family protein [Clostridiales bacterium]|nr:GrpB family protein [Clostridiales bacterium]
MEKELSEMSLEELWALFPIFLVAHNDKWKTYYDEMEAFLKDILSECQIERISHIGSTAIDGIWAKNIVDILIEISRDSDIEAAATILEANRFIRMSAAAGRISFNRGYTKTGFAEKVFHVHLRYTGDHDELYFRDYLNEYTQTAKEYEALKLRLWKQFEHNRDAYTDAKAEFIRKWTNKAKEAYAGKY